MGPSQMKAAILGERLEGFCCATARQKHCATDVLWGLGRDSTHGISAQVISEIGIASTKTSLRSTWNYNRDTPGSHTAEVLVTTIFFFLNHR